MNKIRLITWNCNGAFRRKFQKIAALDADILVIQECEDPARSNDTAFQAFAQNHIWIGPTKNKGIGIFARPEIELAQVHLPLEPLELFLPLVINGQWPLLACWTRYANSPNFAYIGQLWKLLQQHKAFLDHPTSILAGDLNSNSRWDQWDRWWNHSDVVNDLNSIGLESAYHRHFSESQGSETRPTLFHTKKLEKPYHIDYCFLNRAWHVKQVIVGEAEHWLEVSDHMPVCVDATLLMPTN